MAQYHNPKELAISISLEAAELLEIFRWKDVEEVHAIKGNAGSRAPVTGRQRQQPEMVRKVIKKRLKWGYIRFFDPEMSLLRFER